MITTAGGAQIAATIQTWTPVEECDFNFIKIGAHPDTTEDPFNEMMNSLIGIVTHLLKDLLMDPNHEPMDVVASFLAINQAADAELSSPRARWVPGVARAIPAEGDVSSGIGTGEGWVIGGGRRARSQGPHRRRWSPTAALQPHWEAVADGATAAAAVQIAAPIATASLATVVGNAASAKAAMLTHC